VKACTRVGFSTLDILRSRPADIGTGTLIFVCALRHKEAYDAGDYVPRRPRIRRPRRQAPVSRGGAASGGEHGLGGRAPETPRVCAQQDVSSPTEAVIAVPAAAAVPTDVDEAYANAKERQVLAVGGAAARAGGAGGTAGGGAGAGPRRRSVGGSGTSGGAAAFAGGGAGTAGGMEEGAATPQRSEAAAGAPEAEEGSARWRPRRRTGAPWTPTSTKRSCWRARPT
jgi:hypothetical protein